MTHWEKLDFLREDLARREVPLVTVASPFIRMLWAMGISIPPPLFWRPLSLAIFYGSLGLFLGLMLWMADWLPDSPTLQGLFLVGLVLVYGLWGVWFYRRKARQLNLPTWEDYPETVRAEHSDGSVQPT